MTAAVGRAATAPATGRRLPTRIPDKPAPSSSPASSSSKPEPPPADPGTPPPPRSEPRRTAGGRLGRPWAGTETVGQSAAGVIVGFLFWGWIALPLLRGGPTEVRDLLRAKFLNKGPRGEWLP